MKFLVFEDLRDGSTSLAPAVPYSGEGYRLIPPNGQFRFIAKFDARTPNEAAQKYYDVMGFGKYKPMLDDDGNPYPEDNEPFSEESSD